MARNKEQKLLAPCREWLKGTLREKFPRASIEILADTDRKYLRSALSAAGLACEFPDCGAWEVKVDVVGVVRRRHLTTLAFVELKAAPISLAHVGQLLGYCRVSKPSLALLLSPEGASSDLERLLTTYGRTDILAFEGNTIRVGAWDTARAEPDWGSLIPRGCMSTVRI